MTNPPGAMPPLPDLPTLADLASKYAINYASPHHFVMSVYGLKFLLTELGVDNADLIARVAELQADAERWRFSMRYQKRYEETPELRCEAMDSYLDTLPEANAGLMSGPVAAPVAQPATENEAQESLLESFGKMLLSTEAEQAEAPVFVDPTDPGYDVNVLREHVRHLERRVRQLHTTQPTASNAGEREDSYEADDIMLRLIEMTEERDHLRAALASKPAEPVAPPEREAEHRELFFATYRLLDSVCEDHPAIGDVFNVDAHAAVCGALARLDAHYGVTCPEDVLSATTPAPAGQKPVEIVIDGYKGEKELVWYISELQRVRFLNQWLADAYCNKLRDIYKDDFRAKGGSEKEVNLRVHNKLADVWREGKTGLEQWWKEGREKPEDLRFEVEHDALSQRLIAALPPAIRAARGDEVNQK